MIRWILTALALLLLLRLVLRFVLGLLQGLVMPSPDARGASPGARRGQARVTGALVRDPICGTFIPRETATVASLGGETRYYCSEACRDKDRAASGRPLGRAAHG
jgi:uncharacterized protein